MKPLTGHLLLALAWIAVTGDFSVGNFTLGLLVGFGVLWIIGDLVGVGGYTRRIRAAGRLAAVFFWEVASANVRVAHDVLTPRIRARPAIVAVELDARSDTELLLLAILVTLTPGTVVVHLTDDRRRLYVYGMYASDTEQLRQQVKDVFERRILAVTRGEPR